MNRILISRTDSIGDVALTLPLCQVLRVHFPHTELIFIGKNYTRPVVACFDCIDQFWDVDELFNQATFLQLAQIKADCIIHVFPNKQLAALAKKAKIPVRIGTSHRLFHLLTCNHRMNFTRKNANFHEAQLNFHLLEPLGIKEIPSMEFVNANIPFTVPICSLPSLFQVEKGKMVILHPKSKGSALEWPIEKYMELADSLAYKGHVVYFTGTEDDGRIFRKMIPVKKNIIDATGKLSLTQLIYFISQAKALVACSTGPLHIAGLSGINAIGLFSMRRPINPSRWKAIGPKTQFLVFDSNCVRCNKGEYCACIENISIECVIEAIG